MSVAPNGHTVGDGSQGDYLRRDGDYKPSYMMFDMNAWVPSSPRLEEKISKSLRLGMRVWVHLLGKDISCAGTVRHLGKVKFDDRDNWVGVELDAKGFGRHNGTVDGKEYFDTFWPKSGVFVRPHRVRRSPTYMKFICVEDLNRVTDLWRKKFQQREAQKRGIQELPQKLNATKKSPQSSPSSRITDLEAQLSAMEEKLKTYENKLASEENIRKSSNQSLEEENRKLRRECEISKKMARTSMEKSATESDELETKRKAVIEKTNELSVREAGLREQLSKVAKEQRKIESKESLLKSREMELQKKEKLFNSLGPREKHEILHDAYIKKKTSENTICSTSKRSASEALSDILRISVGACLGTFMFLTLDVMAGSIVPGAADINGPHFT